jgi:signal transduction histidine kinase/CheY-like chemotaxis protein
MSRKLVTQANLVSYIIMLALFLTVGFLGWENFTAAYHARRWTVHSYDVLNCIQQLDLAIQEAERSEQSYLLTGVASDLEPYQAQLKHVSLLIARLQGLIIDNPEQQAHLRSLAPASAQRLQQFATSIQVRRDRGLADAVAVDKSDTPRATARQIDTDLDAMTALERQLLAARLNTLETHGHSVRWLTLIGAAIALVALLAAIRVLSTAWARSYQAQERQRRLAERLQTALESLSQGVAVFGPAHRLRHWNDCFRVLLRLPPDAVIEGAPYATLAGLANGPHGPLLEAADVIAGDPNALAATVVYECTSHDDHIMEIRRTPTPERGFVLTVSDMTDRVRGEALLRDAQKMQAIGQLTGGMAHDFNNLLTVIIGNVELTAAKLGPKHALTPHLERALWAAQRGGTLTSQLLAFARKQPLAPAPIDLSAILPDIVPLLRRTLGEHIDVRAIDAAGLWPAMADPAQLESAVLNLALNARDAMPSGGRLTIELANTVLDAEYARSQAEVTPGDYVMVAVSDTGHGMTPEVAARVFEPFFTTKADGRGTGLGLAMVFGFIKQSGGHIKIYTEPGEGTAVKMYLPRAAGMAKEAVREQAPVAQLPRGDATILVVEDEAGVREIAVAILGSIGYRMLEAADGEQALQVFSEHAAEIDLLLTDVVLPGRVRGREVADRITAQRPEVKVLFMSGYTENSIVHHGRLDEGVQLLGKPFKRDQLALRVAEVLGRSVDHTEDVKTSNILPYRR